MSTGRVCDEAAREEPPLADQQTISIVQSRPRLNTIVDMAIGISTRANPFATPNTPQ